MFKVNNKNTRTTSVNLLYLKIVKKHAFRISLKFLPKERSSSSIEILIFLQKMTMKSAFSIFF